MIEECLAIIKWSRDVKETTHNERIVINAVERVIERQTNLEVLKQIKDAGYELQFSYGDHPIFNCYEYIEIAYSFFNIKVVNVYVEGLSVGSFTIKGLLREVFELDYE